MKISIGLVFLFALGILYIIISSKEGFCLNERNCNLELNNQSITNMFANKQKQKQNQKENKYEQTTNHNYFHTETGLNSDLKNINKVQIHDKSYPLHADDSIWEFNPYELNDN